MMSKEVVLGNLREYHPMREERLEQCGRCEKSKAFRWYNDNKHSEESHQRFTLEAENPVSGRRTGDEV